MHGKMRLLKNQDGSYDLAIEYSQHEMEFASEFLQPKSKDDKRGITEFIKKYAKGVKLKAVRIIAAGMIIAIIPFSTFFNVSAQENKYSMAYVYGGTAAQQIENIKQTNNSLNTVSPSYFDINADGSLKFNAPASGFVETMHDAGIKVVPFLSNHWDRVGGQNALQDTTLLADKIAYYVSQYNFDGVNIDIENVTEKEKDKYTDLVKQLRNKIPAHKEVSVAVAANPNGWTAGWHGSYDYTALGQNSDYLMLMTYDEHWQGGEAGPVASIGFVEKSIKYALSKTTSDRVVIGLPFFGRIWGVGNSVMNGNGVPITIVNKIISDYNAKVTFDTTAMSPKAEFTVPSGDTSLKIGGKTLTAGKYIIWYENEKSIEEKLKLVNKYNLKGAGSWALGNEDKAIWNNYNTWLNSGSNSQTTTPTTPSPPPTTTTPTVKETQAWVKKGVTNLNFRSGPGTNYSVLTKIQGSTSLKIIGSAKNGFYNVKLTNGKTGYVSTQYITQTNPNVTVTVKEVAGVVKSGVKNLNFRAGAGTNYKILSQINGGEKLTIIGNPVNGFYKVKINRTGVTGYCSTQYIIKS